MTRLKLGLIIATVLVTIVFVSLAAYLKRPGGEANAPSVEAISYAKPTPDGKAVLVAFGSADAEAKLKDTKTRSYVSDLRSKYAKPGLYAANDASTPIYLLDGYSPDEQLFLSADGRSTIRIEGEWWKTKAYPAGKRLSTEVEQAQLDAVAVRCFTNGVVTHEYKLNELVSNPAELPHSPEHILWPAGAVLNQQTNLFHLFTQDSNKITFDIRTGEIVTRGKNGLSNPIAQAVIWGTVGLTAVLAGVMLLLAWRSRKATRVRQLANDSAPSV
jgi:hypothetical protein